MLSISTIARVTVNVESSVADPKSFGVGALVLKDSNYAAARRLVIVGSLSEASTLLQTYGFAADGEEVLAATKYFGASPSPSKLFISCYPSSETLAEAIAALLNVNPNFYGVTTVGTVAKAEWLAAAAAAEASVENPYMIFVPVTGTVASVIEEGSILESLHGASSKKTVVFYGRVTSDAAGVMGAAMGLEEAHETSAFSLCYKKITGLLPMELTETEVASIEDLGGNVYITRGYNHILLENGSTPSGYRYNEVLYTDMIARDLQEAAVNLIAENSDLLPQTDDTTTQFINAFSAILIGYTNRNILATKVWKGATIGNIRNGDFLENGFAMYADSFDNQTDEDRAAHKAMPIQVALTMAGSVESIVININVRM